MPGSTTDNTLITTTVADSQRLVNPDGTGTVQFRQFLRSLKRGTTTSASIAALEARVAALEALSAFLLEVESGP